MCSSTFYKIRKLIGGLSSKIWKTGDPVSSISLAHPWPFYTYCRRQVDVETIFTLMFTNVYASMTTIWSVFFPSGSRTRWKYSVLASAYLYLQFSWCFTSNLQTQSAVHDEGWIRGVAAIDKLSVAFVSLQHLVSISLTFYTQLLDKQNPKLQKDSQSVKAAHKHTDEINPRNGDICVKRSRRDVFLSNAHRAFK